MERTDWTGSVALARVLILLGATMIAGTLIDFGVLWIGQNQGTIEWEYIALVNTLDGMSGLVIGFGFWFAGMGLGGQEGRFRYRALGSTLMLTGIVAAVLGALLAMDYVALRGATEGAGRMALFTTSLKGWLLSAAYFGTMCAAGFIAVRKS